jgi:two-component system, NtrC family, sensor histidine kinase AtoS
MMGPQGTLRRTAFGGLLLAVLGLMTASELVLGVATYQRLRHELEADLAERLVHVARMIALGTDTPLVTQFREGDEQLPAYRLVANRFMGLARAAGVERAYVVGERLQTLVDSSPAATVGHIRYALLANRAEVDAARAGQPTATPIYQDEEGRLRLSALAPLRGTDGRVVALAGVDATPEFFASLRSLRRQMALLGLVSVLAAGVGGLLLVRQVSRRLTRLRETISHVSRGDFGRRVGLTTPDEIGALGRDLDGMILSLVETRDYYESVLRSADVGLLSTDREGRVIGANPRAAQLLSEDGPSLAGRPLAEVLAREPRLLAMATDLLRGGPGPTALEVPLQGGPSSGGRLVAAVATQLQQVGEWTGLILSLSDVTDLRMLERRMRRNERLAGLGSMAAGLLHELRNPLASMTIYLDLLRPLAAAGEGQEILDRAIVEAARLDRFLQDFQVFAGLRPLRREWVQAAEMLDEATAGLAPQAGVRLERLLEDGVVLHVDRGLMAHAVRNLIVNALEAAAPEGRVKVELRREARSVVLHVADDGPGVPEHQMERIFDPLFTTKPAGTGLGLTIVERVAEAHGALLEVRNTMPGGARFSIRWPAEDVRA